MPAWVKSAVDGWTASAEINSGFLFRPVNRGDVVIGPS
jgi:hypothetical protein